MGGVVPGIPGIQGKGCGSCMGVASFNPEAPGVGGWGEGGQVGGLGLSLLGGGQSIPCQGVRILHWYQPIFFTGKNGCNSERAGQFEFSVMPA